MKDYQTLFKSKTIAIEDAVSKIQSNMTLVCGMCASEPQGIMSKMHLAAPRVKDVKVYSCLTLGDYTFYNTEAMKGHFKLYSFFHSVPARNAIQKKTGTVTFVPNMLHKVATDFKSNQKPHIYLGTCTPPDHQGFVSLSLGITYEKDMVEAADIVILEVNENLPRTFGDTHVHINDVDHFVINHQKVPSLPSAEPSELEIQIGQHIATLVEDGSTIQLGIGGIPNAAAMALKGKKDLGVHTEMFVDAMMKLYEDGVITNKNKGLFKDKFVTTFAMGSKELYTWLHDNMAVEFQRGSWTNDPKVVQQNNQMTSINTCLMVDLQGQVASESFGPVQFSGTGGQTDTATGARSGFDGKGKSIIACKSTAKNGKLSTIVPVLPEGTAVTLHRSNADYIVTEWGIACLRGKSIEERAKALIDVANPDFRSELTKQAIELGYIL